MVDKFLKEVDKGDYIIYNAGFYGASLGCIIDSTPKMIRVLKFDSIEDARNFNIMELRVNNHPIGIRSNPKAIGTLIYSNTTIKINLDFM